MAKVKFFRKDDLDDLEFTVNNWLSLCDVIISDIKYDTLYIESKSKIVYSVMIIYKTSDEINSTTKF